MPMNLKQNKTMPNYLRLNLQNEPLETLFRQCVNSFFSFNLKENEGKFLSQIFNSKQSRRKIKSYD